MSWLFEISATLFASLFAGAALYINLVEHPARLGCGIPLAITEFAPSYKRATVLQVSLSILSFITSLVSWLANSNILWIIGGLLILLVIPYTLIFILPTNNKLLQPSLDKQSEEAKNLLLKWGRLHAVRTILSIAAVLVFLYALTSKD